MFYPLFKQNLLQCLLKEILAPIRAVGGAGGAYGDAVSAAFAEDLVY